MPPHRMVDIIEPTYISSATFKTDLRQAVQLHPSVTSDDATIDRRTVSTMQVKNNMKLGQ
ncbi:hypothetical protein MY11210_008800 [Beauveria gryllotalpidicola]